jgi:POT family proton-dependent oligopeptide transporter
MGINLGAFIAPIVCGYLAQDAGWRATLEGWGLNPRYAWHWGFGAAAVGMFFGLVQYLLTGRRLGDAGMRPAPPRSEDEARSRKRTLTIGVVLFLAIGLGVFLLGQSRPDLLTRGNINTAYQFLLAAVVIGFFGHLFMAGQWTRGERNRLLVIVILFAAAAIFWAVFEQAGSTLTIFADQSTDNQVFGRAFPSSWWQSLNALLIVLIAPFFSWLWIRLGPRNPSYGTKFGVGLLFAGLGFLWLVGGAQLFSTSWTDYVAANRDAILAAAQQYGVTLDPAKIDVSQVGDILAKAREAGVDNLLPAWERVGVHWLFVVYFLHTIGELCLSPVGLSAMTKLAPVRVVGQMMGVWFLASSIGNYLGGTASAYYEQLPLPTLLLLVAMSAFVMAGVMFLLVRPMKRMLAASEAETAAAGHP